MVIIIMITHGIDKKGFPAHGELGTYRTSILSFKTVYSENP